MGILAGGFNPPTVAHLALIEAALEKLDEVVCVVPRAYPHKDFFGSRFEDRVEMVGHFRRPVAASTGGLFIDIAREFRRDLGLRPDVELHFVCGRDAAERIVAWDYGSPGEIERQLEEYRLLVAARLGEYEAPQHLRNRIQALDMLAGFDDVSSTVVRELLWSGNEQWKQHVPESIQALVSRIYAAR